MGYLVAVRVDLASRRPLRATPLTVSTCWLLFADAKKTNFAKNR